MPDSIRGEFTISKPFPSSIAKGQTFSIDMTLVKLIIDDGGTSTEYPNATLKADDYSISTNSEGKIVVVSSSITDNRIQATFRALPDADYSTIDADEGFHIDILLHAYISELALNTVAFTYSQPITLTDDGCVVKDEIQRCVYRPVASGAQDKEILFIRDGSASDELLWRGLMDVRFACSDTRMSTYSKMRDCATAWSYYPSLSYVSKDLYGLVLNGFSTFGFRWEGIPAQSLNKVKSANVEFSAAYAMKSVLAADFAKGESRSTVIASASLTGFARVSNVGVVSFSDMESDPRFPSKWSVSVERDGTNDRYASTFTPVVKAGCVAGEKQDSSTYSLWDYSPQISISNPSSTNPNGRVCIAQRGSGDGNLISNVSCRMHAIVCLRRRLSSAAATAANAQTYVASASALGTMAASTPLVYDDLLGSRAAQCFQLNFSDIVGSGYVLCNAQGQAVSCSSLSDAISKGCLWNGLTVDNQRYALVIATIVESSVTSTTYANVLQKAAV